MEGDWRFYVDSFDIKWTASTAVASGKRIIDNNGNLETCTTAGTTGSSIPTAWSFTGGTTTDGSVVWTESAGAPGMLHWFASASYATVGVSYLDTNGNIETVTTTGTSGSTQPTWPSTGSCPGTTTIDGSVVWTCSLGTSSTAASIRTGGTEDWFGFEFYLSARSSSQPNGGGGNSSQIYGGWSSGDGTRGTTFIGANTAQTQGMYRLNIPDKRNFSNGFSLIWQDGNSARVAFSGTDIVYATLYYYTQN
jgi:hypothetical protein